MALTDEKLESLRQWYDEYTSKLQSGLNLLDQLIEELKNTTFDSMGRQIIASHSSRIKEFESALEKCKRKGSPQTKEGLKRLTDLAGVRIVVEFEDNILDLVEVLLQQEQIAKVGISDYLNAKDSGYRAFHLDVLFKTDDGKEIPIEVQIRTIMMDAWATLDHSIRYKTNIPIADLIACDKYFRIFGEVLHDLDRDLMKARDVFDGKIDADYID